MYIFIHHSCTTCRFPVQKQSALENIKKLRNKCDKSSNGGHSGVIFFKPEKNLEFFRLKNDLRDAAPGRLE